MFDLKKPVIFSGIKPSGDLHIGNYLGAISQWVPMQEKYNCIFCVVNYHAITVKQDPIKLKQRTIDIAKIYLASGIDPKKVLIFKQSDVAAHTELAWLLNCAACRTGDLNKMTQFKEKAGKNQETVSVGLYDYPVLMASDILLYNSNFVPVGDDQVQHVELARELARRFNKSYGEVFTVPEVMIRKEGARIMGLDDPKKKMGKSESSGANYIALNDAPETAKKKIMRAVTDSGNEIKFDRDKKPAIANLLTIYSLLAGKSVKELEKRYIGRGYGEFKNDLADLVADFLADFQKKFNQYGDGDVKEIFAASAKVLRPIAEETLMKAKEKLGILI